MQCRTWILVYAGFASFKKRAIRRSSRAICTRHRMTLKLGKKTVGLNHPTYFVADISANHDGELERAKLLIRLCAEAGADAAKFQNFRAPKIVSDRGFSGFSKQLSHQAKWKKS